MAKIGEGSIRKLEDLQNWFMAQKNMPYFTIYRGNPTREVAGKARMATNDDISDMSEAWSQIEGYLSPFEDGLFKLFVTSEPKGNNGHSILYAPGNTMASPSVNGLPGSFPGISEYDARIGSIINQKVEEAKTIWELNKKIEDLEANQNAKSTFTDRIGAMLEQSFPQLVEIVLPALISKLTGTAPVQPNIAGLGQAHEESEIPDDESVIVDSLNTIGKHIDINKELPKLAKFVDTNPEMVKNLLKNIQ